MLALPAVPERPTSSHSSHSPSLRLTPSDKDLPALPRYVKQTPLSACNDAAPVELPAEELFSQGHLEGDDDGVLSDLIMDYEDKLQSHFSTWSADSMAFSCSTPDNDAVYSPTFSSLTSNCSDEDAPQHLSLHFSYVMQDPESQRESALLDKPSPAHEDDFFTHSLSPTPPKLDDLRISTFGPDLFNLDIQHAESAPRRQAACFGLGFHYSLPEDETTSKTTITQSTLQHEPSVQRESSMSQLTGLMDEFGYLGEAVI
jgi:hypothetical protein